MKTIGLLGGMSWESTASYYNVINEEIKSKLGGFHSAKIIMVSVNFAEIEELQREGRWDQISKILGKAVKNLENGGADFFLICSNTIHIIAEELQIQVTIPLIHIVDAVGDMLSRHCITTVGLLGTIFTIDNPFYKNILKTKYNINVEIPSESDCKIINKIIYEELCLGTINNESLSECKRIIELLASKGAEGVVLGCTELGLLINSYEISIPLFDTLQIHAKYAVGKSLSTE